LPDERTEPRVLEQGLELALDPRRAREVGPVPASMLRRSEAAIAYFIDNKTIEEAKKAMARSASAVTN